MLNLSDEYRGVSPICCLTEKIHNKKILMFIFLLYVGLRIMIAVAQRRGCWATVASKQRKICCEQAMAKAT